MRDTLKDPGRLRHMLDMAVLLCEQKSRYTIDDIRRDRVLFFGMSKIVEIIGEAAYKITKEFKAQHSEMPWNEMEGMRHILVHGYFSISPDILWDVIENDIPTLIPMLRSYLGEDINPD